MPRSSATLPLVSILVNAYNEERYLAATLDSALAQTHSNIEIIVLDDHSTDRTPDIARQYVVKDVRVKYIKPTKRLGLVEGRNELLRQMKGDFFTWLDGDDMYLPDKVKNEVEFLMAYPGFDIVYCNLVYFFDGAPEKIYHHRHTFYSDEENEKTPGKVFSQLLEKMFITNTATMFRAGIYKKFGGYRTDLGIVEDMEYFLRVTYGGVRVAFLDRDLVRYRLRWDSHTNFKSQTEVQASAVHIFEDLAVRMNVRDRERYHVAYWLARRRENYAIVLAANGEGALARRVLSQASPYVRMPKKYAIIGLSLLPAAMAGVFVEWAWNRKKKNLFVPCQEK